MSSSPDHVILVAGIDYPHFDSDTTSVRIFPLLDGVQGSTRQRDWNWRKCALRLARIAVERYGKDCKITIFDFDRGTRERWTKASGELTVAETTNLGAIAYGNYRIFDAVAGSLRPLQPTWPKASKDDKVPPSILYLPGINKLQAAAVPYSDYETAWNSAVDKRGSPLAENSISIIHVYEFIRGIGASKKASSGRIRELHFLSHAWQDGPILTNTPDLMKKLRGDEMHRDPFDKDCRRTKDFNEANYTREQLDQLRAAFSDDSIAYLWGCDMDYLTKELIRQTLTQIQRGVSNFQFTFTKCWGNSETFKDEMGGGADKSKLFSLAQIRELLQDKIVDTYMQALADAIRRPVAGALPGTSSDPDRGVPEKKLLWHIGGTMTSDSTQNSECFHPSNLKNWLDFYKRYCNVTFDTSFTFNLPQFNTPFGRGFIVTKP